MNDFAIGAIFFLGVMFLTIADTIEPGLIRSIIFFLGVGAMAVIIAAFYAAIQNR